MAVQVSFDIRDARLDDAGAIEALRVACWQSAYRGLVADAYLDAMTVEAGRRRAIMTERAGVVGDIVAVHGQRIVGWAVAGPCRDADRAGACHGEIYACYVDPAWWGRGVGRRLMGCGTAALDGAGRPDITLWVLEGNGRALRFYRACGFSPDGARKAVDLGGPAVEVRCRRGPGAAVPGG